MEEQWRVFKQEMANEVAIESTLSEAWTEGIAEGFLEGIGTAISTSVTVAYQLGFDQAYQAELTDYQNSDDERIITLRADIQMAQKQMGIGFFKLTQDTIRRLGSPEVNEPSTVQATFDALNYRVPMILATGLLRSKNYGRARALSMLGHTELSIPNCPDHGTHKLDIKSGIDYNALPPNSTHPNCLCEVT
jgi:hypothetical protein